MSIPTLQTKRLLLRPFVLADAPTVQRLAGDREVASTTLTIPHPYAQVFRTLVGVLPQHKMAVVSADEAGDLITAKTGMTLRTWGETLTIRLGSPDGGSTTDMVIESNLKFGVAAWGKHQQNFDTILNALRTVFAAPAPQAAAPQPPPPQT